MADKKPKKPVRLPAIGKPSPRKPKSSVREMGARAAKDYEIGNKKKIPLEKKGGWPKDMPEATERDWAREQAKMFEREFKQIAAGHKAAGKSLKPASDEIRAELARNTGMYKGGLVSKRKKK